MTRENDSSPASRAMDKAIDLALQERSTYPDRASFIDAGTPSTDHQIEAAFAEGQAAVLVSADGSTQVLQPTDRQHSAS